MGRAVDLLVATGAVAITAGCSTTVIPPADPAAPRTVYILDYGRHASLLVSRDHAAFTEYAYGEWNWFALDRSGFFDMWPTLFWPTRGALGRAEWDSADDPDAIRALVGCETATALRVEEADAEALCERLDDAFGSADEPPRFQPLYNLHFVPSEDPYHVGHNCSHALSAWLEALGCEVRGSRMFADFRVLAPAAGGEGP